MQNTKTTYWLVEISYPDGRRSEEAIDFPPEEALRLIQRFDPGVSMASSRRITKEEHEALS